MTKTLLPEDLLCFDAYALNQAFGRLYKPLLAPMGLTYPQYLVMLVLWSDDGSTVGSIGKRLSLDSGTLTPLLKRLEKRGLLKRNRDSEDERRVRITLTDAGWRMQAMAADIPACVEAATGLSSEEITRLRGQLGRLCAVLMGYRVSA